MNDLPLVEKGVKIAEKNILEPENLLEFYRGVVFKSTPEMSLGDVRYSIERFFGVPGGIPIRLLSVLEKLQECETIEEASYLLATFTVSVYISGYALRVVEENKPILDNPQE